MRYNLDPEGVISPITIRELLLKAGLDDLLRRADSLELDFIVTEGGSNLSVGEKQLICICRAILRKNKVVILDEATASIDVVTEHKILKLISEAFQDATVITIAHRLNTIINSDLVMVLDEGRLAEFDTPSNLRDNNESEFSRLLAELKKD